MEGICIHCGRKKNIACHKMCASCYAKWLKEKKQSEKYVDGRCRRKKLISGTTLEIIKRLKAGEKQVDIAEKFGVTKQYVNACKKRYMEYF